MTRPHAVQTFDDISSNDHRISCTVMHVRNPRFYVLSEVFHRCKSSQAWDWDTPNRCYVFIRRPLITKGGLGKPYLWRRVSFPVRLAVPVNLVPNIPWRQPPCGIGRKSVVSKRDIRKSVQASIERCDEMSANGITSGDISRRPLLRFSLSRIVCRGPCRWRRDHERRHCRWGPLREPTLKILTSEASHWSFPQSPRNMVSIGLKTSSVADFNSPLTYTQRHWFR